MAIPLFETPRWLCPFRKGNFIEIPGIVQPVLKALSVMKEVVFKIDAVDLVLDQYSSAQIERPENANSNSIRHISIIVFLTARRPGDGDSVFRVDLEPASFQQRMFDYAGVPNEIWLFIFENLRDPQALRNITRLMYRAPVLPATDDLRNPYRDTSTTHTQEAIRILYLLRTALARPDLAHAVRSIAVHSQMDLDGLDNKVYDGLFAAEDHFWFGKSLQDHELESGIEFAAKEGSNELLTDMYAIQTAMKGRGLADGFALGLVSHGWLIALLHVLEKLDMLTLRGRNDMATIALICFEDCFSRPIPAGLMNLRSLHISYSDGEAGLNPDALVIRRLWGWGGSICGGTDDLERLPIVTVAKKAYGENPSRFPTITTSSGRTLTRAICAREDRKQLVFLVPPKCSPISELVFEDCTSFTRTVASIMLLPQSLPLPARCVVQLTRSLENFRTLEVLWIPADLFLSNAHEHSIGNMNFLCGLLPHSLVHLHIDITSYQTLRHLRALLHATQLLESLPHIAVRYPNLRKITIHAKRAGEEVDWVVEQELCIGSNNTEGSHELPLRVVVVYYEDEPCRAWSVSAYDRHMQYM
ncbi:hypothetical protein DL93DRAFT_2154597 [Clavulina sp. PMI_390]|nr:hypothetical protein DL93DRAFT_2154597 [Clavulina sp. PMI_390]